MTFKCPYCGFVWGKAHISYVKVEVCRQCLSQGAKPFAGKVTINKHVPLTAEDMQ